MCLKVLLLESWLSIVILHENKKIVRYVLLTQFYRDEKR